MKNFTEFLLEDIKPDINYDIDYYKILDVNTDATDSEIKKAYKTLSMKYHPDRNMGKDTTEKFKEIKLAYDILGNKKWKDEYDRNSNVEVETQPKYKTTKYTLSKTELKFLESLPHEMYDFGIASEIKEINKLDQEEFWDILFRLRDLGLITVNSRKGPMGKSKISLVYS